METGICHKCKQQIFNGIPEGRDVREFVSEMKLKGVELGYFHETVGSFGHTLRDIRIKPICSKCSKEQYKKEAARKLKNLIRKISPQLKKGFVCPVCEREARSYNIEIFKSSTKAEMIRHIEEKHEAPGIEKAIR